MQVDLRRRDILVPQKLLDRPQIRPVLQQVRCKRMPQRTVTVPRCRSTSCTRRRTSSETRSPAPYSPDLLTIDDFRMLIFNYEDIDPPSAVLVLHLTLCSI
jgi:hypothetical protein